MSKVRINDLARELEVKSRSILDALTAVGVTESKTHSSSIEADEAEKVRAYFKGKRTGSAASKPQAEAKPAFNLSNISKPGRRDEGDPGAQGCRGEGTQHSAARGCSGCAASCGEPRCGSQGSCHKLRSCSQAVRDQPGGTWPVLLLQRLPWPLLLGEWCLSHARRPRLWSLRRLRRSRASLQ
jgi:hypothetical protein